MVQNIPFQTITSPNKIEDVFSCYKCSLIFFFINRNSAALGRNTTIGVFGGSIDDVADIVDGMESNPDAFADSSDTE